MLFDPTVGDATFVDGWPPKDLKKTLESIREELGLDGDRPWSLISARTKLGRVLFEIEEETTWGPRRLIGKLGKRERAVNLYQTLLSLRDAGFRPPARITVPEPVACLPERGLVLQEKVAGAAFAASFRVTANPYVPELVSDPETEVPAPDRVVKEMAEVPAGVVVTFQE